MDTVDKVFELLKQRRIWVVLIPAIVMLANAFGATITEEMLQSTGEQVLAAAMSVLALWSYLRPKRPI